MQRYLWVLSLLAILLTFSSTGGAETQSSYRSSQPEAVTQPRLVVFEEFFSCT